MSLPSALSIKEALVEYPKNDSIDNGTQYPIHCETAANLRMAQDVVNDDALASGVAPIATGPDLAAVNTDRFQEIALRARETAMRARETAQALQARGIDFARETKVKAERNPWMAIAAASASALAVGLILGRVFKSQDDYLNEEYPSGYDE